MDAKKAEKIAKALANPNRLTILKEIKIFFSFLLIKHSIPLCTFNFAYNLSRQ